MFARRLERFYESTSPLLDYYRAEAPRSGVKLVTLSGSTSDEIWPQLENVIRTHFPHVKERVESREHKRRTSLSEAVMARKDNVSSAREEASAGQLKH